jgi:hypothetical protein
MNTKIKFYTVGLGSLIILFLCALLIVPTSKPGTTQSFAQTNHPKLGTFHVAGRFDGLIAGWDVAFYHIDTKRDSLGFYLDHESEKWSDASLKIVRDQVLVFRGNVNVAQYDARTGTFTHSLQRVVYSRSQGKEGAPPLRFGIKTNLAPSQK